MMQQLPANRAPGKGCRAGQLIDYGKLDRYAFGVALGERGIPGQYNLDDLEADLRYAGGQ